MNEVKIPKWTIKFLRFICPDNLIEEIEGDLFERFNKDLKHFGLSKARQRFVWNSIRYLRPGILFRNKLSLDLNQFFMIANYFKVAYRVMFRNKAFSSINILGLAVGMTGALLLFIWIHAEFSYETFHTDKTRIYKIWNRSTENGQINCWDVTPRILARTLSDEFSSVENSVSFANWGSKQLFTVNNTKLLRTTGAYTDSEFLNVFSFPLLKGDVNSSLTEPTSIVLTESFAKQLFGDKEPFGETLSLGESGYNFEFKVTGILKDLPSNTDFKFDYLIPFKFLESLGENDTNWDNNSVSTYVKIKEGTVIDAFNNLVKDIKKKHSHNAQQSEVFLYPLTKMRLYSRFENGVVAGGRIEIIRMLTILGVCLVLIACINFINLSTARSQRRAKEVGVRKVIGAYRSSIILQFLCESVIITLGAGLIALIITYFTLPLFNMLIQQQLTLNIESLKFWLLIIGLIIIVALLAGSYPALYLSSFRPARILKGQVLISASRNFLRNTLVVLQFGFSIMLIVSAIVIYKQISFVQNREVGYDKYNLIYQPLTGDLEKNYLSYKNDLIQNNLALSITKTSTPITERWSSTTEIQWNGKKPEDKFNFERIYIDEHFSSTASLSIIKGRDMNLSKFPSDSTSVLLNESAVKAMNFDDPIGEVIIDNGTEWHVIGVVKDFILTSPYQEVEPLLLMGSKAKWALQYAHIKLNPENSNKATISKLSDLWLKYNPSFPFEYYFVDIEYQRKFANLEKTLTITTIFTSIAIFIACLGLLGLSTYMIEARLKEIGIRKIFGGTVVNITKLLGISSLKPILFGILIFSPLSWLAMNWWLQSFTYRTELSISIFIIAAVSLLAIALITVSIQTIGAANANPIKSLRNE
ncbi:MAG: ABC transporter permease [Cyclobacteriaceae bacterium]|nr:ABC transporter permease [Cyclobacteriaceae bacterium]